MRPLMPMPRALLLALLLVACGAYAQQAPSPPPDPAATVDETIGPSFRGDALAPTATLTFQFDNPQLQPAHFVITLHASGAGHFTSQIGPAPTPDPAELPPEPQDRAIVVSDAARDRIFSVARKAKGFAIACESTAKNVAQQGTKVLTYQGPEAHGSCTYNYSNDAKIQWLTSEMLGIAATLESGRRLAMQHKHGRLTLDAELESLANLVRQGDATELENIAPVLQAIIADENVILHARRRAQALLDSAPLSALAK